MAIVYAVKTGNWSDTTVWNTGALPTSADDVYPNTFTVTINQNINVISLRNGATTGVTAGGQFVAQSGFTYVCDTIVGGAGAVSLFLLNFASGSVVITANTIIGGVNRAITMTTSASVNVTINGNLFGSPTNASSAEAISFTSATCTAVINGNCTAQVAPAIAIGGGMTGLNLTINGVATSSSTQSAISNSTNSATNIFTITKAATPDNGVAAIFNGAKLASVTVTEIEQGVFGQVPISGFVRLSTASGAFYKGVTTGISTRTLSDPADIAGQVPAQSDVRFGVTYQSGSKTGTAYIPAAASVGFGVPVDNTTGTAALTPASVWDVATSTLTTASSIGERLKNASTVDTTGDQLAALL
jgi:hypothetical protein